MDLNDLQLDDDGKVSLDDIYNEATPVAYFSTLQRLGYAIPQNAKPVFRKVLAAYKERHKPRRKTLLDLGSSYGVNAAILKHSLSMTDLSERYGGPTATALSRAEHIARDRNFYAARGAESTLRVIGLDRAEAALAYATEAGILDGAVCADLESEDLSADAAKTIAGTDLVISTGCVGYVGEATFGRLLEAFGDRRPWMAHFVLRMFDFTPMATLLGTFGYVTECAEGLTFPQRRFASRDERQEVLGRLAESGIDVKGKEGDGWLHASFFLARPAADVEAQPLKRLLAG